MRSKNYPAIPLTMLIRCSKPLLYRMLNSNRLNQRLGWKPT